ncbi:hypothetical protein V2J74_03360 [Pseudomonas alliivorans]|nr:hypothetical protein [Pseudomonas alliivorans]
MSESHSSACLKFEPQLTATASVFHVSPGDVVVLKHSGFLSAPQRQMAKDNYGPVFKELGCKFLVLDGSADLMLVKKASAEGSQP